MIGHRKILLRIVLLICLISSFTVSARQVLQDWSAGPVATDFRIFMTGIELERSGQGSRLYSFDAQQAAQTALYPETRYAGLLPFNHVAYELLFYFPFAKFSYHAGLIAWAILNIGIVFLIAWLMRPQLEALRVATAVPAFVWIVGFYPVIYVLAEGQDSLIFLLFLVLSFHFGQKHQMFLSGFALSLGCFKFHIALMIAFFVLLLPAKWRAVFGFAIGAALVGIISFAMVGRDFLRSYLRMLRSQETMTPWGFNPHLMPNLRGLLHSALFVRTDAGTVFVATLLSSLVIGLVTSWVILHHKRGLGALYALAVLTTILLSYHLHVQDLSMAVFPMLLLLDFELQNGLSSLSGILIGLCVALLYIYRLIAAFFVPLLFNASVMAVPVFLLWAVSLFLFLQAQPSKESNVELTPTESRA